jgi:hypothetical protein
MGAFLFTCPNTAMNVHGWSAEEVPAFDYYEAVECAACKRVHFVNPRTGEVVGSGDTK